MSLFEEQQDARNPREVEVEEQGDEERGMEGHPPDVASPEEKPSASTDVTATPSFQYIDELLSLGKISPTRAAKLKSSCLLLCDTLKSTQDSEIHLWGEAKRCRAELEGLRAEVVRTEEEGTSADPESEVNELRQQLLQAYNQLKASEDRGYKTRHRMKCLWLEKQYLEKENEIQLKPAELESRTKTLQDTYEDLKQEVYQRRLEVRSLTEDVEAHETQILKEQKELTDKMEIIKLKEAEKAGLISIQVLKEKERSRSEKQSAMKKMEALDVERSETEQQVKEVDERNRSLMLKKEALSGELDVLRARGDACQRERRQRLKELELSREEEAEFMGSRGILEMKLQSLAYDGIYLHHSQSVQLKEKQRQSKALTRMEHALTTASEQLEQTQSIYIELHAKLDAVPKQEASVQQRMALQKEVDALKARFRNELSVAEEESQKVQQCGMIQGLLSESNRLREELHNLRCLTRIKVDERGQKHREMLRAEQLNQRIQQELRERARIVTDHDKLNTMLQRRVVQRRKLCDMIAAEKKKYVGLKQSASQTTTELTEQIKVLENEAEIQRTVVISKGRSLTKVRMKISNSSKIRDRLHNDISKVAWKQRQVAQEYEDNQLELMKLTQTTNLKEQALLEMNKNQETAIQRRNFLGLQLLEHDDVLLNYYEKVNLQEAAVAEGNATLEGLEKEMRDLRLEINEEKRRIDLKKKEVPVANQLAAEIAALRTELSEARDRTLAGLNKTVDYKELKGKDPSTAELVEKIEQLEANLAESERQSLEKELLVEQVTRLSKPLSEQAESCHQDRLWLAKKLNELRSHIMDINQRTMAVTAQLSVTQAVALSLQQEIKEKELQMDRCQRQLEQGRPPCPELEEQWRRMLRDKKRRQRDKEEREKLAEEEKWNQLPNGRYTTAEARPNAYIPQTDSLPLPKPYGAQAPFRPSPPAAYMRHFRDPTLKPLDI
ncbi:coiled-coil domain-containing protein 146 [Pungitius pungitius]|uniref:coiled-coil domain-containing protein 146 n=1 Tax=Pungitius pungitius TaxID=134920 RepID=UPI002E12FC67